MKTNTLNKFLSKIQDHKKKHFEDSITISTENVIDHFLISLWWVVGKEQYRTLNQINTLKSPLVTSYIKFISSRIHNINKLYRMHESINKTFMNSWVALEYFLMDSIHRNNQFNDNLSIQRPSIEIDELWIDFSIKSGNHKYGIQLSYRDQEDEIIIDKYDKTQWIATDINKWRSEINNFKTSPRNYIDMPILMIINSNSSKKIHNSVKNEDWNILFQAFQKWEKEWFKSDWPSMHLDKDIQEEFKVISTSLQQWLKLFKSFIKKWDLSKTKNVLHNYDNGKYTFSLWYSPVNKNVKVIFFKKDDNSTSDSFIYSLDFFVTDKFIQKLSLKP